MALPKKETKAKPKPEPKVKANKAGQPTLYKPEYNDQVYKLCLLGATDKEIADFFDVCEKTINNWKIEHIEFLQSIRAGKKVADMEVASSMFKTTQDRIVIEQQAVKCKEVFYNEDGKRVERETVEIVEVERVVPANERNQQFWLKNRKADSWRDKQEVDHTSKGQSIIVSLGSGKKPDDATTD